MKKLAFLINLLFLLSITEKVSSQTRATLSSVFWLDYEFPDDTTIKITMTGQTQGYVSIGFAKSMKNCDMVVGGMSNGSPWVSDYYSNSHNTPSLDSQNNVQIVSGSRTSSTTSITFTRKLNTGDSSDYVIIPNQSMYINWAYGSSDSFREHINYGDSTITFTKSATIVCHSTCLTCSGTASNQCLTCSSPKTLVSGSCITCDPSCLTCSGTSSNQCTTCASGKNMVSGACITCDSTCLTCSGSLSTQCTSCASGKNFYSGSCITCDASCLTCSGTLSSQCLTCGSGKNLISGSCITCAAQCLTCSGPQSNQCLSCASGKILVSNSCVDCDATCKTCSGPNNNQCLDCPSNFFLVSGSCVGCHSTCLTCTGSLANECLTCPLSKNLINGACIQCDSTCATCSGSLSNQCVTCPSGKSLASGSCITCSSSCLTCSGPTQTDCLSCQSGKFLNSNNQCQDCDSHCKTCTGSSQNNCSSCFDKDILFNSACVTLVCDLTCLTCSGTLWSQCLTCPSNRIYSDGYCLLNDASLPSNYAYMKEAGLTMYWEFKQNYVIMALKSENDGWFSIGFGEDMSDSDIILVQILDNGTVDISDRYSKSQSTPKTDVALQGSNDITVLGFTNFTNNERIVKFSRKQITGDSFDKDLNSNPNLIVLAARTSSNMVEDHGPLYWTYKVNFVDGYQGIAELQEEEEEDDPNSNSSVITPNSTINSSQPIRVTLLANKFWIDYHYPENDTITITMTCSCFGYLSIGFGYSMKDCDMVTGRMVSGVANVVDMWSTNHNTPVADKVNDVFNTSGKRTSQNTSFTFSRKLKTSDTQDTEIVPNKPMSIVYAFGATDAFVDHGPDYGTVTVTFLKSANVVCHTSCLTCSGTLSTQCVTCASGKTLISGQCLTVSTNCDSSCKTCVGSTAKDCLTCESPKIYSSGQCLQNDVSLPSNFAKMTAADITFYWDFSSDYVIMALKCNKKGWFSIGFGSSMKKSDMIVVEVTNSDGIIFSDRYSNSYDAPANDTALGGSSDYQILGSTGYSNGERIVKFKRKQVTGDKYDWDLSPNSNLDIIAALTDNNIMVDHKKQYWFYKVNFVNNSKGEAEEQSKDLKKIVKAHTIVNIIGWGFLADIGIFFAKYLRHKNYYLIVHLLCFLFTDFGSVIMGLIMLAKFSNRINEMDLESSIFKAHIGIAILSLIMTFIQHIGGVVIKHKYIEGKNGNPHLFVFKFAHLASGYFLYIIGKINVLVGFGLTEEKKDLAIFLIIFIIEAIIHISSYLVYKREPQIFSKKPNKVLNTFEEFDVFMMMLKDNKSSEEIKLAFPNVKWVIFNNGIYDLSNFVHPGGNFLINPLVGKEVGRYLYGAFGLEGVKMQAYTHTVYAMNLLEYRYLGTLSDYLPSPIAGWDKALTTGKVWKVTNKVDMAPNISLFCFQNDHSTVKNFLPGVIWIGRHFTIKSKQGNSKVRLYTTVLAFTKENRAYNRYLEKGYDALIEDREPEQLEKAKIPGESEFLPFIIKKYDFPNGFSNFVHTANSAEEYEIEGPIGRGMELNPKMEGTVYLFAGGTGILPFLDFLDYLFKKAVFTALQDKKLSLTNIFNEDYVNTFDKSFKVVLFGSFATLDEFIGYKSVKKLYDISQTRNLNLFDMTLRFNKITDIPGVKTTKARFDMKFLLSNFEKKNLNRAYVCGPPSMNDTLPEILIKLGVPKEKINIV